MAISAAKERRDQRPYQASLFSWILGSSPKEVEWGQRRIGVKEHVSKREKKSQKGNDN